MWVIYTNLYIEVMFYSTAVSHVTSSSTPDLWRMQKYVSSIFLLCATITPAHQIDFITDLVVEETRNPISTTRVKSIQDILLLQEEPRTVRGPYQIQHISPYNGHFIHNEPHQYKKRKIPSTYGQNIQISYNEPNFLHKQHHGQRIPFIYVQNPQIFYDKHNNWKEQYHSQKVLPVYQQNMQTAHNEPNSWQNQHHRQRIPLNNGQKTQMFQHDSNLLQNPYEKQRITPNYGQKIHTSYSPIKQNEGSLSSYGYKQVHDSPSYGKGPQLILTNQGEKMHNSNSHVNQDEGSLSSYGNKEVYNSQSYTNNFQPIQNESPNQNYKTHHTLNYMPNQGYEIHEASEPPDNRIETNKFQQQNFRHQYGFLQPAELNPLKTHVNVLKQGHTLQQIPVTPQTPVAIKAQAVSVSNPNTYKKSQERLHSQTTKAPLSTSNQRQQQVLSPGLQQLLGMGLPPNLIHVFSQLPPGHIEETLRILSHLQALQALGPLPAANPVSNLLMTSPLKQIPYLSL